MIVQDIGELAYATEDGETKAADIYIEDACDFRFRDDKVVVEQSQGEPVRYQLLMSGY